MHPRRSDDMSVGVSLSLSLCVRACVWLDSRMDGLVDQRSADSIGGDGVTR